ncbi:cation:proton antiporter [Desulfovermiculus halophilus]|uniref:cation:proton antiporter n=1 Tax=Desulfovermiculus halophilus TaxID=339722 RepID=UPI0004867A7B|nr:cation:proton antiporter [Desulfovermiculus halophilus]
MHPPSDASHLILFTGAVVVTTMLVKGSLERTAVPPLVGYLLLGVGLSWVSDVWPLFAEAGQTIGFFGQLGLVALLFRVGLKSDITVLVRQLRNASLAWILNVVLAGVLGYYLTASVLGYGLVSGLIVGAAFTATSVGVSVKVWEEKDALNSKNGALLVDLAELDDVSAVVLMALVFTLVPLLQNGGAVSFVSALGTAGLGFVLKMAVFGALCYLFAVFWERPLTSFLQSVESRPDSTLTIVGFGFVVAALAGMLGFSLAIGAFFAGLVFSRDPKCISIDDAFVPLYDFFSPFFFVSIGYQLQLGAIVPGLEMGLVLAVAAVGVKVAANGLPVAMLSDVQSGTLVGMSMVPRAEISLVIMQKGMQLGDWAVDQALFGAMVTVSAITCLVSPMLVRFLLTRWPQDTSKTQEP